MPLPCFLWGPDRCNAFRMQPSTVVLWQQYFLSSATAACGVHLSCESRVILEGLTRETDESIRRAGVHIPIGTTNAMPSFPEVVCEIGASCMHVALPAREEPKSTNSFDSQGNDAKSRPNIEKTRKAQTSGSLPN